MKDNHEMALDEKGVVSADLAESTDKVIHSPCTSF